MAITRAERLLFITHAKLRTIYGNINYTLPSRFLDEMPKEYIKSSEDEKKESFNNKGLIQVIDYTSERESSKALRVNNQDLDIGDKVNHKKWGVGTIVQIKERDGDKELVIAFDKVGLKRLLLSIAPIEILKGE